MLRDLACIEAAHSPEQLWVELSYLPPQLRSANVAIRPLVRNHEIVVGTMPGGAFCSVIPLDELVIGIRDGRFSVRWPGKDVEVVACAGHMLNSLQAPEVCRFLDDVRHDGVAQLSSFDWGPAAEFPFLPRVQIGRIVLASARWRINHHARSRELPCDTPDGFRAALHHWRARWQAPQHVYLSVGDNRLLLDLEDAAQVEQLRSEVRSLRNGTQLVLHEALPSPNQAWTKGPDGHYITELLVPLVLRGARNRSGQTFSKQPNRVSTVPVGAANALRRSERNNRTHPPGSDWLFAKLYCPHVLQDDLITGSILAFSDYVCSSDLADKWFFIRYSDPDSHLRLRFHGSPQRLVAELIPQLCAWATNLITEGLCSRFCFDTYDREIERYGGPVGIVAAETLFAADSRAVAELLRLTQSREEGGVDQTTLGVLSIDHLLAGLGLTETERLEWYRKRVTRKRESGSEYRQRQSTLRRLLGDPEQLICEPGGPAISRVLATRQQALGATRQHLDTLLHETQFTRSIQTLCNSFVHMHYNRLFGTSWPTEEHLLELLLRAREGLNRAPSLCNTDRHDKLDGHPT